MLEQLSTLEKVDAASRVLDQLTESKGRDKCAQICVLGDLLDLIRKDVLVLEEKAKDQSANEPPAKLEIVENESEYKKEN